MKISPDSRAIEGRLQRLLLPSRRRRLVAQLLAMAALLSALGWVAAVVLVQLVRWMGPWWQQSR
jgi:hypothetical protein